MRTLALSLLCLTVLVAGACNREVDLPGSQGGEGAQGDGGVEHGTDPLLPPPGRAADNLANVYGFECGGAPVHPELPGDDLHRVTLKASDALCNDGSPAVMFVRKGTTHPDRWVVHLGGTGECMGYTDCAVRWCTQTGPYHKGEMTSLGLPEGIAAQGLLDENAPPAPVAGWNQVVVHYCSSDEWRGRNPSARQHSRDGGSPGFTIPFLGRKILEAAITQLRDGTTSDDGDVSLPPLASDAPVLFAGSGAGSVGLQQNADFLTDAFEGPVDALFDGRLLPDYVMSEDLGDRLAGRIYADGLEIVNAGPSGWNAVADASCAAAHEDDPRLCFDVGHVLANHITTPFFARADLDDALGVGADLLMSTPADYRAQIRAVLLGLTSDPSEESASRIPVVLGTRCGTQATLGSARFRTQTVKDAAGTPWSFAAALADWTAHGTFEAAVDSTRTATSVCP